MYSITREKEGRYSRMRFLLILRDTVDMLPALLSYVSSWNRRMHNLPRKKVMRNSTIATEDA